MAVGLLDLVDLMGPRLQSDQEEKLQIDSCNKAGITLVRTGKPGPLEEGKIRFSAVVQHLTYKHT